MCSGRAIMLKLFPLLRRRGVEGGSTGGPLEPTVEVRRGEGGAFGRIGLDALVEFISLLVETLISCQTLALQIR